MRDDLASFLHLSRQELTDAYRQCALDRNIGSDRLNRDRSKKREHQPATHGGEARYANYLEGGVNEAEFVIDFGQHYQGDAQPCMHTRIVTAPAYMKVFVELLQNCIAQYETRYGPIREIGEDHNPRNS
jgi:Protein of unknown function (DUF3467)